jgi:hypothetical protein
MCLRQVNPLRDLCGGASLEGRELPWTRKERGKGKEKKRKEREKRTGEEMFCQRGDVPARLCDVLNERYV